MNDRAWIAEALRRIEADVARSADTHLLRLTFEAFPGIGFYFKDESTHPTGSLKHRLARSLFLYALCNGWLAKGQTVIDASSGSTAISEAWFARLLDLPYIAVVPADTAARKIREIEGLGGRCERVAAPIDPSTHAAALARSTGAHFLDQFGNAERATDWRGNNNIAESIIGQLRLEPDPEPAWFVCGAGTGGTAATVGRYVRYRRLATQVCVAEPEGAAFARGWRGLDHQVRDARASRIEGIGRAHAEPAFVYEVVDDVIEIPDVASCAGAWLLEELLGRRYGGSSGTNLVACLELARRMRADGRTGAIVTLLCDRGERYADTVFDRGWLAREGLDIEPWMARLRHAIGNRGGASDQPVTACSAESR